MNNKERSEENDNMNGSMAAEKKRKNGELLLRRGIEVKLVWLTCSASIV